MESQEERYIKYKRNTELRHLDPIDVYQLGLRLDENDYWKKLMEIIPKKLDCQRASEDGQLDWNEAMDLAGAKYNNAHISLIENATKRSDHTKLFTQTLIDEWSTSGRKHERPTVGVLLQLLVKANLFRAADYVAAEFLGEAPPERPLEGPARRISIQLKSEVFSDIKDMVNDSEYYPETEALNQNLIISNSINDNNKDYYTKYKRTEKDLNIIENCNYKPTPPPRQARSSRLKKTQPQQQQQQLRQDQNHEQNSSSRSGQGNAEATTATLTQTTTSNTNGVLEAIQERDYDGTSSEANIPNLQELLHMQNPAANHLNNSTNIPSAPTNSFKAITTNTESTELSMGDTIPNLSIFLNSSSSIEHVHKEPTITTTNATTLSSEKDEPPASLNEILPVISALNVNGEYVDGRSTSPLSERSESNLSKDTSLDDDISYPTDSKEEDDDDVQNENDNDDGLSMPNLSIFGERQSNNDSSLTSVTGTSGENSFDLSTNESISSASNDENIPCLSILNQ